MPVINITYQISQGQDFQWENGMTTLVVPKSKGLNLLQASLSLKDGSIVYIIIELGFFRLMRQQNVFPHIS